MRKRRTASWNRRVPAGTGGSAADRDGGFGVATASIDWTPA